jgi:anti-anti-sigma regulatory factor
VADAPAAAHLVIDLNQVTFIDAAGLNALIAAANRAATHGTSLHVVCARPQILKLFRLTGLDRRLPPAPTLDEALAGPGPQPPPVEMARPPAATRKLGGERQPHGRWGQ